MAWSATDNFNSYLDGDLNSLNGGTGWATAWSGSVSFDIQGTVIAEGTKAVENISGTAGQSIARTFTGITDGILSVKVRGSSTAAGREFGVILTADAVTTARMLVLFNRNAGQIAIYNNTTASYENIQAFTADTWYTLDIEFNDASQPDSYRARIDGGAWTAWKGTNGAFTNVDRIVFHYDPGGALSAYWDDIKNGAASGLAPSQLLTMMGVGS